MGGSNYDTIISVMNGKINVLIMMMVVVLWCSIIYVCKQKQHVMWKCDEIIENFSVYSIAIKPGFHSCLNIKNTIQMYHVCVFK